MREWNGPKRKKTGKPPTEKNWKSHSRSRWLEPFFVERKKMHILEHEPKQTEKRSLDSSNKKEQFLIDAFHFDVSQVFRHMPHHLFSFRSKTVKWDFISSIPWVQTTLSIYYYSSKLRISRNDWKSSPSISWLFMHTCVCRLEFYICQQSEKTFCMSSDFILRKTNEQKKIWMQLALRVCVILLPCEFVDAYASMSFDTNLCGYASQQQSM